MDSDSFRIGHPTRPGLISPRLRIGRTLLSITSFRRFTRRPHPTRLPGTTRPTGPHRNSRLRYPRQRRTTGRCATGLPRPPTRLIRPSRLPTRLLSTRLHNTGLSGLPATGRALLTGGLLAGLPRIRRHSTELGSGVLVARRLATSPRRTAGLATTLTSGTTCRLSSARLTCATCRLRRPALPTRRLRQHTELGRGCIGCRRGLTRVTRRA